MSAPVHYDVEAAVAAMRDGYRQAEADARSKARNDSDQAYITVQMDLAEMMVAACRAELNAANAGAPKSMYLEAIGAQIGSILSDVLHKYGPAGADVLQHGLDKGMGKRSLPAEESAVVGVNPGRFRIEGGNA